MAERTRRHSESRRSSSYGLPTTQPRFNVWNSKWEDLLTTSEEEKSTGRPVVRNTKIVCTLGPASCTVEQISALLKAGMNIARLNFSHGTHESHAQVIKNIREANEKTGIPCAILLDNKGPEIRTGLLKDGKDVEIAADGEFDLHCNVDMSKFQGDAQNVACDYKDLPKVIKVGQAVKIDDGLIITRVVSVDEAKSIVRVKASNTALLGQRKGVNLPGVKVTLPSLTEKDKADLLFGVEQNVDFVAMSFTRKAEDVHLVKEVLKCDQDSYPIRVIAKIENQEGLDNFDEILRAADGIMVARGDLGVEIDFEKVVVAQKMMISKCNLHRKPVITATQMLESMVSNPRPTRAEATDVANATLDGTDCVMLSGETAKGKYPVQAVEAMASIVTFAERLFEQDTWFINMSDKTMSSSKVDDVTEVCCAAGVRAVHQLKAAGVVVVSNSGSSAKAMAKYKPGVPIVVVCPNEKVSRQLLGSYGLQPVYKPITPGSLGIFHKGIQLGINKGYFKHGDKVILIKGIDGVRGSTNTMQVAVVAE